MLIGHANIETKRNAETSGVNPSETGVSGPDTPKIFSAGVRYVMDTAENCDMLCTLLYLLNCGGR